MKIKDLIESLNQFDENWIVDLGIDCLQVHPDDSFYPEYIIDFIEEESVGLHLASNKE